MAITAAQQQELLKVGVGMFNASLGGYIGPLATAVDPANSAALTIDQLYDALAGSDAFKALNFASSDASTNAQFATWYANMVLGTSVSAANITAAADALQALLDAGSSRGAVIKVAVDYLSSAEALADTTFGPAAQQFANKVTVAEDYTITKSGTSTNLATLQNTVSSVDATEASVTAATSGNTQVTPGGTFSATTSIDNLTGTSGNDTFIGDAATLSNADQMVGAAGTDTLKMYGTAGAADIPAMSGIETVFMSGPTANHDLSSFGDVSMLQLDDPTTGTTYTVGAAVSSISVATVANGETIDLTYPAASTAANVTLTAFGTTSAGATLDLNGAGLVTLNLTGATTKSYPILGASTAATLKTVNIAGDQAISLDMDTNGFTKITKVDASAATGAVTAIMEDGTGAKVSAIGGTGADVFNFGAKFDKDDSVDGGAGTDTLAMTQASVTVVEGYSAADKATVNTNLSNLEKLQVTDALTSNIDASRFDSVNSFVLKGGINNGGDSIISNIATGVTVEINDAATTATDELTLSITNASLAGNNSDTVNLKLADQAAGGASDLGVIELVGVDIVNIEANKSSTSTTTGYTLDIKNTATALDTVTVTGGQALDLTAVALTNSLTTFDGSAATGAIKVTIAAGGTSGVTISSGTGADSVTGGDGGDVINAGSGNDTINGSKGDDVLTGGAGNDVFQFAVGDSSVTSTLFDTITDYSNGTVVNTSDKLDWAVAGVVATTGLAGWTLNTGVATKSAATLADFITIVQATGTANETYAFVDGSDTYVYNAGGNGTTNATDDTLIKLAGFVGVSVVTADTTAANEIFIA